jgi:hypothetical protein
VTSLTTPSGIGVTLVRSAVRDSNLTIYAELDHLQLRTNNGQQKPLTFIDATGIQGGRFHNISMWAYPGTDGNGQIGIVCADVTTGATNVCFFNHFYDIDVTGVIQTMLHWSGSAAGGSNSAVNSFDTFRGVARVLVDTTSTQSAEEGMITNWYFSGDSDPNSWDIYPTPPEIVTFANFTCEACVHQSPWSLQLLSVIPTSAAYQFTDLASIRTQGGISTRIAYADTSFNLSSIDSTMLCGQPGTAVNLPAIPASLPAQALNGQIVTFRPINANATCVISGNGHLIDGASTFTVTAPYTVTMQWTSGLPTPQWRIISQPAGQLPITTVSGLPTCGASQNGMMYTVSDASSPTYNGTLTGGGSTKVPVFCNGTAWTAH